MSDGSAHEALKPLSFNLDPAFAEQRAALESELHRVHMRLSELRLPPAKRILGQRLQLLYTDLRVLFLKGSLTTEAVEPLTMLVTEFHELLSNRESLLDATAVNTRLDSFAAQVDIGMCSLSPRSMVSRWPALRDDAHILLQEPLVMPRTEVTLAYTYHGLVDVFPVVAATFPPEFRDITYHSIQVWSKLQHPCVMPIVGMSAERHDVHVAWPFAYKRTLREYLAIDSTVDRLTLLYDLARGLVYLHTEGIVYGDLHNTNILMGDDATPIFNFTFAVHESSEHTSDFRAWRQRTSVPCARYLAPELINDDTRLPSTASDVYALACIAYELFASRAPFEEVLSDTIAEARVLRGMRPTPERKLRSCGEGSKLVRKLITRAWAHDPAQRPTAVVFAEKVKEALETRGQRDGADSKSLPPIPPDANDAASSTFEDVNANEHTARDEAKSMNDVELARQAVIAAAKDGQASDRSCVADVVHHLLHASFAALAGPIDADNERRFLAAFTMKSTWTITGCPRFARLLRLYGGPHPASVSPRGMLRHCRLPSVLFEFRLVSSLLPFMDAIEGYEFTATVAWTAWRLVEPEQIKGRGRLVWMDSAYVADCSTASVVAKGFAFDAIAVRDGAFRIDHRTLAIQHVAQPAFFAPFSIAPQKNRTRLNTFERCMTFVAWVLWPLQRACTTVHMYQSTILAAAVLLASTPALIADDGARAAPGAIGLVLAAALLFLHGLGYLLTKGDALRAWAAAMKLYEDEIRGAGESASQ